MAAVIKTKKASKKGKRKTRDPKKEATFRALSEILLEKAKVKVRREKLKQGHGWRAISGACRLAENTLVFVDSKLSQDEQVEFLLTKLTAAGVSLEKDYLEGKKLPAALVRQLLADGAADDVPLEGQEESGHSEDDVNAESESEESSVSEGPGVEADPEEGLVENA